MTLKQLFARIDSAQRRKDRFVRMKTSEAVGLANVITDLDSKLTALKADHADFIAHAEGEFAELRLLGRDVWGKALELAAAVRVAVEAQRTPLPWFHWKERKAILALRAKTLDDMLRLAIQVPINDPIAARERTVEEVAA